MQEWMVEGRIASSVQMNFNVHTGACLWQCCLCIVNRNCGIGLVSVKAGRAEVETDNSEQLPPPLRRPEGNLVKLEARRSQVALENTSPTVSNSTKSLHLSWIPTGFRTSSEAKEHLEKLTMDDAEDLARQLAAMLKEPVLSPDTTCRGKVFIGNLPCRVTEDAIREYFSTFGPVRDVAVMRSQAIRDLDKAFCFLYYGGPEPERCAQRAAELNGVEFEGQILTIRLNNGWKLVKNSQRENSTSANDAAEFLIALSTDPDNDKMILQAFKNIQKPRRREYDLLVEYYGRRGDKHNARSSFESMRAAHIHPTVYTYTNLIRGYAIARDMRGAVACMEEMKSEGITPNDSTYGVIVSGFAKTGNSEVAELWLEKLKNAGLVPDVITFSTIIDAYCKSGNSAKAEELLQQMKDLPTLSSYNDFMTAYSKIPSEQRSFFDDIRGTPATATYGCLIYLYSKIGRMTNAMKVSWEMQQYGMKHDTKSYSMIVDGYARIGDAESAIEVFKEMLEMGLRADIVAYNIIVNAVCKCGQMKRAMELLNHIIKEGLKPTVATYTTLIDGFVKAGNLKMAMDTLCGMKAAGLRPKAATFNALLNGLAHVSQMKAALSVMDQMVAAGITPNYRSYTILIEGYARIGEAGESFKIFNKMLNEGLKIDLITYSSLLKACCKAGRMRSAYAVLDAITAAGFEKNKIVYSTILDGWARRGDILEAQNVMEEMESKGIVPDIVCYTSFINACCKAGDMQRAEQVMVELNRKNIVANINTYTTLIRGFVRAGLAAKALGCYQEIKERGLKQDLSICRCLMAALLSRAPNASDERIAQGIRDLSADMARERMYVDLDTAAQWMQLLQRIEWPAGSITAAVTMVFPSDWYSKLVVEDSDLGHQWEEDEDDDDVDRTRGRY